MKQLSHDRVRTRAYRRATRLLSPRRARQQKFLLASQMRVSQIRKNRGGSPSNGWSAFVFAARISMTRRVEFPAESATSIARFAPLIFALKRFEELTRMPILRKIQTHRARYFCTHCAPVLFLPSSRKFQFSIILRSSVQYHIYCTKRWTSLTFVYLGSINYILTFLYVLLHSFTA